LWAAERPIMLLGGSRWSAAACAALARFADRFTLPVATTFRRAHLFDPAHPCYAGDLGIGPNPKLLARVKGADLILLVGGRLGELPSQSYTLIDIPGPRQTLVHVFPGVEELGRVYRAQLAINATPTAFAAALEGLEPPKEPSWRGETPLAHADFLAWTDKPTAVPGPVRHGGRSARALGTNSPRRRARLHGPRHFPHRGAPLRALPPLRHTARADLGLHGLWGTRGHRNEASGARAHGHRLCRRRRFPDDG